MKRTKIIYLVIAGLFLIAMTMDGIAGLLQEGEGRKSMQALGYPFYLLSIVGTAKLVGVIAILQPWFKTIKEWAFAGFAINFAGASASWALATGEPLGVLMPLIFMSLLLTVYFLRKKVNGMPAKKQIVSSTNFSGTYELQLKAE